MGVRGLDFIFDELDKMAVGTCPACRQRLPELAKRSRWHTCDEFCRRIWINKLIAQFGETKEITDVATGFVYLVPTRVILETGIGAADLPTYPRKA